MRVSFKKIMFTMLIGFTSCTLFSCNAENPSSDNQFIEDLQSYKITLKANDIEKNYSTLAPSKNPPTIDLNEKLKDFSSLEELEDYNFEGFYTDSDYSNKFENFKYTFSTDKIQDTLYLKFINDNDFVYEEHSFGQWNIVEEPTLTTVGFIQRNCKTCFAYEKKKMPALSSYVYGKQDIQKASCTEFGQRKYTYTIDGQKFTFNRTLPKLEHNFVGGENVMPTFETSGKIVSTCLYCGLHMDAELPILNEQNYLANVWQKNTCSSKGVTYFVYTNNTEEKTDDLNIIVETPLLEHEYITKYSIPTCVKKGVEYEICKNCGNQKSSKSISLEEYKEKNIAGETVGHSFSENSAICSLCGKDFSVNQTLSDIEYEYVIINNVKLVSINYDFYVTPGVGKKAYSSINYNQPGEHAILSHYYIHSSDLACFRMEGYVYTSSAYKSLRPQIANENWSSYNNSWPKLYCFDLNHFDREFVFELTDTNSKKYKMTITMRDQNNIYSLYYNHTDDWDGEPEFSMTNSQIAGNSKIEVKLLDENNVSLFSKQYVINNFELSCDYDNDSDGHYKDHLKSENKIDQNNIFNFNYEIDLNCSKKSSVVATNNLTLDCALTVNNTSETKQCFLIYKYFGHFLSDFQNTTDINCSDLGDAMGMDYSETIAEQEHFGIKFN